MRSSWASTALPVERLLKESGQEANLDVAAAEFTSLVRNAQKAGKDTGLGELRELMISLDGAVVIMRLLGRDYFVVLAIGPDGNLGRARYELRKAELQLLRKNLHCNPIWHVPRPARPKR